MKHKKRILFAIDEFSNDAEGGAAVVVKNLIQGLIKRYEIGVVTTHRSGEEIIKMKRNGYWLYSIKVNYPLKMRAYLSLYNPLITKKLKYVLNDYEPDILHIHIIHTYITYHFIKMAQDMKIVTILTCHDLMPVFQNRANHVIDVDKDNIPDTINYKWNLWQELIRNKFQLNPFRNIIIRSILNNTIIVSVSSLVKNVLNENGINSDYVINNAITHNSIKTNKIEVNKNKVNLLFAGRLRYDKGSMQVITILNMLPKKYNLHVAGKSLEDWEEMKKYASSLGIIDRIIYHGFLSKDEMSELISKCDCTVIPSLYLDPFPTIGIESLFLNKPVIASTFCGLKDVIENYFYLKFINPYNVGSFRDSIINTIGQTKIFHSYSQNNHDQFSKFINKYVELYENNNSNSRIYG